MSQTAAEMLAAGMKEVTHLDLISLAQEAYDLSEPQGMGWGHFKAGPLPHAEADQMVALFRADKRIALSLDYVSGRAVKLTVFRASDDPNRLFVYEDWFDHSGRAFEQLLERTQKVI